MAHRWETTASLKQQKKRKKKEGGRRKKTRSSCSEPHIRRISMSVFGGGSPAPRVALMDPQSAAQTITCSRGCRLWGGQTASLRQMDARARWFPPSRQTFRSFRNQFSTIIRLLKSIDLWGSKYTAHTDRGQQRAPNYWSETTSMCSISTSAHTHTHLK